MLGHWAADVKKHINSTSPSYYESSPNKLKATPNAVDLAMDLLLSRPAKTDVNQPIPILKNESPPTPKSPLKKVNICTRPGAQPALHFGWGNFHEISR